MAEAQEIGLDEIYAAAYVGEILLIDWLTDIADRILQKYGDEPDPRDIVV